MKLCITRSLIPVLLILLLTAGVNPPSAQGQQPTSSIRVEAGLAKKVIDTAKTVPGVRDATAVVIKRDILVGVKVTGFDRLRLQPLKAGVRKKIKAKDRGYSVIVTADKKLFSELRMLETQIQAGGYNQPQILQKAGKIKKDMGE